MDNKKNSAKMFAEILNEKHGIEVDVSSLDSEMEYHARNWFTSAFRLVKDGGHELSDDEMTEILVEMNVRGMKLNGEVFDEEVYRNGPPRACAAHFASDLGRELFGREGSSQGNGCGRGHLRH